MFLFKINKLQKDNLAKMAKQIKVTANLESIRNWVFQHWYW